MLLAGFAAPLALAVAAAGTGAAAADRAARSEAPPLVVTVAPDRPRLGDLVRIDLSGPRARPAGPGRVLAFFCAHPLVATDRGARGYVAVPADTSTGTHPVRLLWTDGDGDAARVDLTLHVSERSFERTELRVAPRFTGRTSPALRRRLDREQAQFDAVWGAAASAPEDLGAPTPPVRGAVTGRFGTQRTFNGVVKSAHYGLDVSAPPGRPVGAAWPGEVALSGSFWGSGRTVVLNHGAGLHSLYFHLSRIDVRPGARVAAGARVGAVGRSGRVTGPHLHFAVAVQCVDERGAGSPRSMYVDPEPLLVPQ